ncbi:phosphoglucomutase, alpha-D-glucose phosphate-specific [Rhodanobacter thiooxydans]|uniref:Phosphoglucomutase n=1 Tax=Rhodanobacter thiooxydans TaxID=416169 RepID=A0A154QHQ9_9GAMM|nr:phosphoglucomutase (alpha-D-glucose-1,6-bisphosphate-dependent) [Rhodanobacter thiooxydans]EIL96467.1 phosphoglucomutase [Rhodanobacter thiooxydans LCS2]KZC23718.1 phosphoglucomutase, alpha-D-glucose phosphate-specific [Rhodanobacter thiooxydans]MCW0201430.1 phosphoglucomutase (alpha-D-glucose-1,6-bisphosphate-dependent) [Rhodanobacter thiooxydans]
MSQKISPLAGKPAPQSILVDVPKLLAAYADLKPDPSVPAQRVAFGTSGHRGNSFERSFNEAHILAISQAICEYRKGKGIDGPLFIGADTHALSQPAFENALEVLAANGVQVMISSVGEYTPTPAVSHAILVYNKGRSSGLADGIVITPSHNPPDNGGFKYNPTNGGPADSDITKWVENRANALLEGGLKDVRRMPYAQARKAATTHEHDYLNNYIADLANIVDFDVIRGAGVHMGVDPLGGAGVHYWAPIAERYKLDLTVVSEAVDPQFAFMSVDWDGKIRMDPSSKYAMQRLIGLKDRYDVAFACDTDHDRHGIVTRSSGLMEPNHYLSVLVDYLFRHRPQWGAHAAVGKTVVSTALLDRVAKRLQRKLYEVPVGFKWFAPGLFDGSLGFGCEESAGASLLRRDGTAWVTDKDGLVPALLSAEITAREGKDPGELYARLTNELGKPFASRVDAAATPAQKAKLAKLSPDQLKSDRLAGETIEQVLDKAPGNGAAIGGIKAITASGWFAARPSGTEAIYKVYAESFKSEEHLQALLKEAQGIVDAALA